MGFTTFIFPATHRSMLVVTCGKTVKKVKELRNGKAVIHCYTVLQLMFSSLVTFCLDVRKTRRQASEGCSSSRDRLVTMETSLIKYYPTLRNRDLVDHILPFPFLFKAKIMWQIACFRQLINFVVDAYKLTTNILKVHKINTGVVS